MKCCPVLLLLQLVRLWPVLLLLLVVEGRGGVGMGVLLVVAAF